MNLFRIAFDVRNILFFQIKSYPRRIKDSVRPEDNKRAEKRKKVMERKKKVCGLTKG